MLIGFEAKLLNRVWTGRSNKARSLTVTCREITLFRCNPAPTGNRQTCLLFVCWYSWRTSFAGI